MIHFELIVYIIEGKTKVFFIFWKYVDNSVAPASFVIKLSISIFFENQWWYMLDFCDYIGDYVIYNTSKFSSLIPAVYSCLFVSPY